MATIVLDNTVGTNVVNTGQYYSVWFKPYWTTAWQHSPYTFPETSAEYAAPADSTATLTRDYGRYVNLWNRPGATLLPANLANWFVKIVMHTEYGNYISWIGVVLGETTDEGGIYSDSGLPLGKQVYECRGLEYLLERRNILGTYVGEYEDGEERLIYLTRTRDFNRPTSRRESLAGNRSSFVDSTAGCYLFGEGNHKWSNLEIALYLLAGFQPWVPVGSVRGQVSYVPLFRLAGQTSGLDYIQEYHSFHGLTVRECLNKLIDRKRGFGWKIQTDGDGPIYIYVFSLSQYPVVADNAYIPANPMQMDVPIHDDPWIHATIRMSAASQVDQIVVESTEPVKTMATLSFLLGSLEPAWDPSLDSGLPPGDESIRDLAEEVLANFDSIDTDPGTIGGGFITLFELVVYAEANPSGFSSFGNTAEAFRKLDSDSDGLISREDLAYWIPPASYQTATDAERATDKYGAVFSHFQVPKDWAWAGWAPAVSRLAKVDIGSQGAYWNHDGELLRFLPILEPGYADDAEREYMEPFAVIQKANRNREILLALANDGNAPYSFAQAQEVIPDLLEAEFNQFDTIGDPFDLSWAEILAGLEANPETYIQLDTAHQLARAPGGDHFPACSLRMGDAGLKVIVKSEANHVFAKNHFPENVSEVEPEWDYETLLVTVCVETDVALRVRLPVYTNVYESLDANGQPITVQQRTPQGREIYIEVPDKEVWIAAPNTVVGLNGESLEYFRDGAGGIIRDDTGDLRLIAQLAFLWWGQQRASAQFAIANQLSFFQTGYLVRATLTGRFYNLIGTCVTGIERNYQEGTHVVTTGYAELDPVQVVGEVRT